jgi:signal transduction histidine kinase
MSQSGNRQNDISPGSWLEGGGEMGKLVRSMEWAGTPLGPIEAWPQSLRTTVSLGLASNFPISLVWGPGHVQIYNDGYWPICGGKHPHSMGQDFTDCWASAWPAIGEAFEHALEGRTSYLENQRMFLDRNGYLEETFFTFSFSPIRDETGGIGGLFHPVTETTEKMVGERRMRALRDIAARVGKAKSTEEAFTLAAQIMSELELDLPFVLFYLLDADATEARLVARTESFAEAIALPSSWPLSGVVRSKLTEQIDDLESRFGAFQCGPYHESPKTALALPILPPGCERPLAIMVAGVSSRLPFNESYRAFYDLLAAAVTSAVANTRAYEEERKRAEALAEIDRAKTAFFSNVSHEFRTPLTLMLGPLEDELAEHSNPLPLARRERLETAHRNSLRLLKLVNTLLDFSRIEAGRIDASYERTDLATYTAELVSNFRSAVEKAGLTLTVNCPPLPEPIHIDRDMWEKIVLNLVSNALKHTFSGGIRVSLSWCGDHARLTVADSGVGIPADELPRLFDRFHRVKGAKSRSHEGTGIGLALVQELVRVHGGTVVVESREGEGSTFTATVKAGTAHLPAGRPGAQPSRSTAVQSEAYLEEARQWIGDVPTDPVPTEPGEEVDATTPRPRVLLADDNADMREYVRRLLARRYDVTAVPDGAAAVASALARPPDLVLTDVMMPGLDGFGVLRELRANDATRTIPVILLSARAGEESAVEGLEAGADDYLSKPFSARELVARVRTHLEMARLRREWAVELEAANKALEAFSYSVSHDLRTPLRAVDGFSQALLEDFGADLPEKGRGHVLKIRKGAQRMGRLIDDLLAFSRLSRQALRRRAVDTEALVLEVLAELEGERQGREVEIRMGDLSSSDGDPALLRQVWVNLLSNALKYTRRREAAVIEIGSVHENGRDAFFVRDNGAGFDMRYARKLFAVFQRLHREDEFEGTGVGLAIVHRIVQRHGGRVWAEGEVERGATFHFTLNGGAVP